jgi:hypothetical protein
MGRLEGPISRVSALHSGHGNLRTQLPPRLATQLAVRTRAFQSSHHPTSTDSKQCSRQAETLTSVSPRLLHMTNYWGRKRVAARVASQVWGNVLFLTRLFYAYFTCRLKNTRALPRFVSSINSYVPSVGDYELLTIDSTTMQSVIVITRC